MSLLFSNYSQQPCVGLQIRWAEQSKDSSGGKKGSKCMTVVQWLDIKARGASRLCSLREAFREGKGSMDAYDQKAAHKVWYPCCNAMSTLHVYVMISMDDSAC